MWHALILALLLMLTTVTAQAELTSAEKVQILTLAKVMAPLEDTPTHGVVSGYLDFNGTTWMMFVKLTDVAMAQGWTPAIGTAFQYTSVVERDLAVALLYYLHANPYRPSEPAYAIQQAKPPGQWISEAQALLTDARQNWNTLWFALQNIPNSLAAEDQWWRVYNKLQALPMTGAFTDWPPRDYPQVIGPHGDYDLALNEYAQAWLLGLDELSTLANVYFYPLIPRALAIGQFLRHALLKTAMIPMNPISCTWNRFRVAADSVRYILGAGLNDHNNQMIVALDRDVPQTNPTRQQTFDALAYQWGHADAGAWQLIIFPNPARLGLAPNRAIDPPDWTAPLCP